MILFLVNNDKGNLQISEIDEVVAKRGMLKLLEFICVTKTLKEGL